MLPTAHLEIPDSTVQLHFRLTVKNEARERQLVTGTFGEAKVLDEAL